MCVIASDTKEHPTASQQRIPQRVGGERNMPCTVVTAIIVDVRLPIPYFEQRRVGSRAMSSGRTDHLKFG